MTTPDRRPYREFGGWLRSRRQARRWTQQELARRLGYDVTYVRKIEWGERRPSDALRVRLAGVLGVPLSILPTSVPPTPRHRLPDPVGALIGRAEHEEGVGALFSEGARLITLVGPPGIGKTRLALALASRFDDGLTGGARFVPLLDVPDANGVPEAVAGALGIALQPDDEPVDRLANAVHGQEMLLVLDNFEHVTASATLVAELLARAPLLRILVTSRHALDVAAECPYALPPLALPDDVADTPDRLADVASVELFLARARAVRPDFALTEANAAAVADICTRVQGIPLAIELAAAAVRFLSPRSLLAELGHGLDLPVAGPRDAPEHHRTLRAAIGSSFDLLSAGEKMVMARLSVFAGGCTIDAAKQVCRLPDEPAIDVRSALLALAAKSLLESVSADGHETRFVALESVRAFSVEHLSAAGELELMRARHAEWSTEVAEANERSLTGRSQAGALAALEREHPNMRAALRWSLEHDPARATRLCAALWRFWWIRGHLAEGRGWLEAALAQPGPDDAARATALIGVGVLARTQGAYREACGYLEEGLRLSRAVGARPALALALLNVGTVELHRCEYARARALFQEARGHYAAIGDLRGVGHCLNCLATARLGEGDLAAAHPLFEQALAAFRPMGDQWSVAMVLANLGWVAYKQGRQAVARPLYEKALVSYRQLGDDRGVAGMLLNLGIVGNGDGDVAGLFEEALLTFARLGERRGMAECLEALAADRLADDAAGAVVLLGAASDLRSGIGAPLSPEDRTARDRRVASLRAELGDAAFDVAWQEGRLMPTDDVMAVALTGRRGERRPA